MIAFVFIANSLRSEDENPSRFSVGPYLGMKVGINSGSVLQGRKNFLAPSSVPDVGASLSINLSKANRLSFLFDLGYGGYAFGIKDAANFKEYTQSFTYLTFAPGFNFTYITLHMNFGVPLGADWGPSISTSKLNFITEVQLGVKLPVYEDATGALNLYLKFGYMLSGAYKDFGINDPLKNEIKDGQPPTDSYNPKIASAQFGVSYLFNL